jgi:hypothetical protein
MHHLNWKDKFQFIVKGFIFTSLIFFSLRINFEKLSYNTTKGLVWFFFQYIVGLVCLFFLVNYILKAA